MLGIGIAIGIAIEFDTDSVVDTAHLHHEGRIGESEAGLAGNRGDFVVNSPESWHMPNTVSSDREKAATGPTPQTP